MQIKVKDLRKLIRENYAREIPQYAIDETCLVAMKMKPAAAAKYCSEQLQHYLTMYIYATAATPADKYFKINKMLNVLASMEQEIRDLKNLKDNLKDIADRHVRFFLFV